MSACRLAPKGPRMKSFYAASDIFVIFATTQEDVLYVLEYEQKIKHKNGRVKKWSTDFMILILIEPIPSKSDVVAIFYEHVLKPTINKGCRSISFDFVDENSEKTTYSFWYGSWLETVNRLGAIMFCKRNTIHWAKLINSSVHSHIVNYNIYKKLLFCRYFVRCYQ